MCPVLRPFGIVAFVCLTATPLLAETANVPTLTYSSWSKFCFTDTCFISRDGRLNVVGADGRSNIDCGSVVGAALIERKGDTKNTLRVNLPNRVSLERGVRIAIDQGSAIEQPFLNCGANGCYADRDAGLELVDQLKKGQMIVLQAFDRDNSPISLTVPLAGFEDAYDGSPQAPKVFQEVLSAEEMQARLDRDRRAEEERKARCPAS